MLHQLATFSIHWLSKLQQSWKKERSEVLGLLNHHNLYYSIEKNSGSDVVKIKNWNQSYRLRHATSDFITFKQVIIEEEYDWLMNMIKTVFKQDLTYIIDAGANIGLASSVFKRYFPDSAICALEPENENFKALNSNAEINNFNQFQAFKAGLWSKSCQLSVKKHFRDGRDWSFTVIENFNGDIQAYSVKGLAEKAGFPRVDLLKIDIEGSEFEVFKSAHSWKNMVKFIAVEVHEEFGHVQELSELLGNEFEYFKVNETYLFFRK